MMTFLPRQIMGHLSLYRRYRPQTFASVLGQEHVTQTLRNAVSEGQVAHAYLFSGPRGTGKTSTARILAKAINCERRQGAEPCNECSSCVEITGGTSLDVVEIDAASHGSVDDARELREKVAYAPVGGRRKVYIYDECHMLTAAANNALLKVLEEPPPHVVFVFATTEPHKVLPTLLDRCQRYEFRSIETDEVAALVAEVCESEQVVISEDALATISVRSAGSARDALTLVEQLLSFAGEKVTLDDVRAVLGSVPEEILFEAVDVISERDVAAALSFTDRLIRSGRDIREFTRALVDHLRSMFLIVHAASAQEILDAPDEQMERLRSQTNRFDRAELLRLFDLANEIQLNLRQAIEGRLALEIGFARMTSPQLHSTPTSMLARIERLERMLGVKEGLAESVPAPPPPKTRPAPEPRASAPPPKKDTRASAVLAPAAPADAGPASQSVRPVDTIKVQEAWDVILQKVKSRKVSFGAVLLPARPAAFEEGELVLEFGPQSKWHRDQASDPTKQTPLIEAFHDTFGIRPRIRCVDGSGASPVPKPSAQEDSVSSSEESPETSGADPVELVRQRFSADVVEDR